MTDQPIDQVAVRILGALIEKRFTTPDNYPLTLNALTSACNQSSNRDPVMDLDEQTVARGLAELGRRTLVRAVHRSDSRAMRYREEMSLTLHLHDPELAALCVLMLRGPQTAGEIRTRAARMFQFVEPRHVEITLESLMALPTPLVTQLPRQRGQKETRYAHLLAGEPRADVGEETEPIAAPTARSPGVGERVESLEQEVGSLRAEVAELRAQLETFKRQFD
jgi:uncharacterized protein YceH (UPF0502 family)